MRRLFEWLGERLNPIVVLEARRGLRTRVFSVAFSLLLVGCLVVAMIAYGAYASGEDDVGQASFVAFYGCLAVVGFFILPYGAYRSLSREREEQTWPLLVLTRMGPARILNGKLGSSLLQALLYASAVAPFLLFSYLLQGIELLTVVLILGASVIALAFLIAVAVAAASLAESRIWRGIVHFAVLGGLACATVMSIVIVGVLVEQAGRSGLEREMVWAVAIGCGVMVAYGIVLFAVAISRLTFDSDNHAFWPRLSLLLHFVATATPIWIVGLRNPDDAGVALAGLGLLHAFAAGLFLASTPPGSSRRLIQQPPRFSLLGLLLPGAKRGLRFAVLLIALFAGAGATLLLQDNGSVDDELCVVATLATQTLFFLCLPLLFGRGLLKRLLPTPAHLRVFTLFFLAVGLGGPPLAAVVLGFDIDDEALNILNPIVVLDHYRRAEELVFIWPLGPAMFLIADRVLARRDREALARLAAPAPESKPKPEPATLAAA